MGYWDKDENGNPVFVKHNNNIIKNNEEINKKKSGHATLAVSFESRDEMKLDALKKKISLFAHTEMLWQFYKNNCKEYLNGNY